MSNSPTRKPNIIVIIMDDLAWGDLACHGNPYTATPNLDRLHAEGTRLSRYYSGPLCTPARACLMTGRYAYRTRAIDTYCGRSMMDPDEVTVAEVLRDTGYRTGIFGKWHLGDNYPMRAIDQGFEEALVHNGGGLRQPANVGDDGYFNPELMHNGTLKRYQGYCTDIFTDASINFIREHHDNPFFIYLATNAPHSPFEIGDDWTARYQDEDLPDKWKKVYGMVDNIDHNVGRIMATVSELGLDNDTLIVYTSDHGPCGSANIDGRRRFNAGLRGQKSQHYDGGLRVPCFFRWPGQIPAGVDMDRISSPIDILPTLVAMANADCPADRTIDGCNLTPLLTGTTKPSEWPDRMLFSQWHRADVPVKYRNYGVITQRHKLLRHAEGDADELYDLLADPGEANDLATQCPDEVATLRAAYERWFEDVSSTRGEETYVPPRIHVGNKVENPVILTRQDWRIKGEEGWTDEHEGYWLLQNECDAPYRIVLEVAPQALPAKATLVTNGEARSLMLTAQQEKCVFDEFQLNGGKLKLEAWTETAAGRFGVRYVTVERVMTSAANP